MSIDLMTGAFGRSRFLLEAVTDFKFFEPPTPRIHVRIARVVEIEGYLFLGKRIVAPSPATRIKMGATVLIVSHRFSLLPFHLSLPSPFTAPWLTLLFIPPLLSFLHRPMLVTQGTTPGWKAP
jgi:hypothetical protein